MTAPWPDPLSFFQCVFPVLNKGYSPYPWQTALFEKLVSGLIPNYCSIPTGLGKTSAIHIWLLAIAWQAMHGRITLPRRLVYIVNRRTVVDQATTVAEEIVSILSSPPEPLKEVASALDHLAINPSSVTGCPPLAVSTLRGQLADNEAWKSDPARPSVIIGTVDMIGSKLLFNGYGDGRWKRPLHAGLIGQDVLCIHDEAHLTAPFGELLRNVVHVQNQHGGHLKRFAVMEMSATPSGKEAAESVALSDRDLDLPSVVQRLKADKTIVCSLLGKGKKLEDALATEALKYDDSSSTVIVFTRSPDRARKVADIINSKAPPERVCLLTGTLRGKERDSLVDKPQFKCFLSGGQRKIDGRARYLVSTSAGEVGADLDADVGVMDLSTIDSVIQRLGRINRTGGRSSRVSLVIDAENLKKPDRSGMNPRLMMTLEILKTLPCNGDGFSASPHDLSKLVNHVDYPNAADMGRRTRTLASYNLDTWSATGLDIKAGPDVDAWLHGISESEEPDTWLVWRRWLPLSDNFQQWIEACPIAAREQARLPLHEAQRFLAELLKGMQQADRSTLRAVLICSDGSCREVFLDQYEEWQERLAYGTLILQSLTGGLSLHGAPDVKKACFEVKDVSDEDDLRETWFLRGNDDNWAAIPCDHEQDASDLGAHRTFRDAVAFLEQSRSKHSTLVVTIIDDETQADETSSYLICLKKRKASLPDDHDISAWSSNEMLLDDHAAKVVSAAQRISTALDLPNDATEALLTAAMHHDLGKNRRWWQMAIGNSGSEVYAKYFSRKANWSITRGYRHEFGALMDYLSKNHDHSSLVHDLTLHLIAAHHGYARPSIPARGYDMKYPLQENKKVAMDVMRRFERLQRHYGWWGLAYLEALLKTADLIGSSTEVP